MQCLKSACLGGNVDIYVKDEAYLKKIMDKIAFK